MGKNSGEYTHPAIQKHNDRLNPSLFITNYLFRSTDLTTL